MNLFMDSNECLNVEERVDFFKLLVRHSESKFILDTGILGVFDFSSMFKLERPSDSRMLKILRAETTLLERMKSLFREEEIVFPNEVRKEYDFFTNVLERQSRERNEYDSYVPMLRARKNLLWHQPTVGDLISKDILPYSGKIDETVRDISNSFYNTHNIQRKNRENKGGVPEHAFNDEHILAKAFTLTYSHPVRLVSPDTDFIVLYREIMLNLDKFFQNGVPSLPDNIFDLVFVGHNGSMELFNPESVRRNNAYFGNK